MDFKVKCVGYNADERHFTIGKIYEVTDGCICSDGNYEYTVWSNPFLDKTNGKDFESLKRWFKDYYEFELVEDKKVFTKSDLKNGDVIKRRNGNVEIIVLPLGTMVTNTNGYNTLDEMKYDLTDCDGDDEFDIVAVRRPCNQCDCSFGAFAYNRGTLVYDRERDTKPTYYNGKVVCVNNHHCNDGLYTVGKIYQFEDGVITTDDGVKQRVHNPVTSFEEWEKFSNSKFIEIVE